MTNLVPNVWAGVVIPMPFAALALILRLKARRMTRMGMGYDDGFSIAAWFFAVGYSTIILIWVEHFKLGQKIGQYPQSQIDYILEKSYLILWISEFLYSWSICLSKLAVLTFYRRMFQLLPIRWPILLLMVACVVWILIRTFVTLFRCSPVQYYWDKSIHGRCTMDVARYYFATDLTHTLLDTLILALPIFEVLRMKLPFGQKIAVVGLFSCGFFVCIASAFQIIQSQNYDPHSQELPYQLTLAMVWGSVEVQLAVFASCLPLLRPIFRKLVPGLSTGDSYGTSRPSLALHPSTSFRNTVRSPRDGETSDTSLPQNNSSSMRVFIDHREYRLSSLPGSHGSSTLRPSQSNDW
ncbi:hypothetical protein B0J15DRAFT_501047 [Fusarium solani]|uniref:Rhodopsin domain-containing protein n=1 Tax=Fusarium solani TaxID=169388 RepID=A0A9P9K4H9_FUSSL|nr:uncharacterized protein B0J15DRAFT_501047 [Fusarium solani]KAH7243750.1 hypothetical protein B0J15DRAFT_501047 [Fusarium solani]